MFDFLFAKPATANAAPGDWSAPPPVAAPPLAEPPPILPPLPPQPSKWRRRWVWIKRGLWAGLLAFLVLFVWLAFTAPLSKSLEPIAPPRLTLLAADGQPIAQNGANIGKPVKAASLPPHVKQAFMAIEDRRFMTHWGVDPRGLARAAVNNLGDNGTQGGSTITQQLAKITFLTPERSLTRKAREMLIAFWLEAWLTKDEILERYLSNVYFGDNAYGLRAASLHYFYRQPEKLTLPQAAMLAGLVQAPSRLAPTKNPKGAEARARRVIAAMVDAGYLTPAQARAVKPARLDVRPSGGPPTGTYFADWAVPQIRALTEDNYGADAVKTTLDTRLQRIARNVVGSAGLGKAQVALVAMKHDGEVVAMIGGRSYDKSPFNRATQARRQPGSTFKLFVYLAALRSGMRPDSLIDDSAIVDGAYRPRNSADRYSGEITLEQAFARSSNVAAVRLYRKLGDKAVIQAARDLGVKSPLAADPSLALGSSGITLLELTSAYAAVAAGRWPVQPHAIAEDEPGFFASLFSPQRRFDSRTQSALMQFLKATIDGGTGRAARLAIPAYGKTGTSQDNRDALFVGFAGDLIVGVWVGNDDNTPLKGVNGGGLPARLWRDFMAQAVKGARPVQAPKPAPLPDLPLGNDTIPALPPFEFGDPDVRLDPENPGVSVNADIGGMDFDVDIGPNGVNITRPQPPPRR